ncbi:MAG TPA: glycosyltransferase family 2 protein [Steroidobacteraceae bacterium]|jgi:glycosyltransferase involved in cell wall biosynthesis|nr:glycosyltransferase family 2 protein [Steroidobacteraceae bacterium]
MLSRTENLPAHVRGAFEAESADNINVVAVVPVYNHHRTVVGVAAALKANGLSLVLVDDGSHETCRVALKQLARESGATLVRLEVNGGKGAAVVAGLRAARSAGFTHALQVDADGQHSLVDVPRFIEAARLAPRAVICGRPLFDASLPRARLVGRHINQFFVRLETLSLTKIRDAMCGFRVYPIGSTLDIVDGVGKRMDFDVEVLVKLAWRGRALRWIDTRVCYPADGISHYRFLFDNALLVRMHARLLLGMVWRAPRLILARFTDKPS